MARGGNGKSSAKAKPIRPDPEIRAFLRQFEGFVPAASRPRAQHCTRWRDDLAQDEPGPLAHPAKMTGLAAVAGAR